MKATWHSPNLAPRAYVVAMAVASMGCGAVSPHHAAPSNESASSHSASSASHAPSANKLPTTTVQQENKSSKNSPALLEEIDLMMGTVSRLRALAPLRKVPGRVIGRRELIVRMQQMQKQEVPPSEIRGQQLMLQLLGLIPASYDLEAGVMRILQSQLAGYYDPKEGAMFLLSDLSTEDAAVTLAHELVHALQDQHFDLRKLTKYRPGKGDEITAAHCLAEGDATSAMLDYILRDKSASSSLDIPVSRVRIMMEASTVLSPQMANEPHILLASLTATYVDGFRLVLALRKRGGWAEVDRVWQHPPTTSEQVLHLDKLDSHEPAIPIKQLAPPPGISHPVALFRDQLGEQGLRLVFEEWTARRVAARGAQGWGGDQAAVFVDDATKRAWLGWRIDFDPGKTSTSEAQEAWAIVRKAARRTGQPSAFRPNELCWSVSNGRGVVAAVTTRNRVVFAATTLHGKPSTVKTRTKACRTTLVWARSMAQ